MALPQGNNYGLSKRCTILCSHQAGLAYDEGASILLRLVEERRARRRLGRCGAHGMSERDGGVVRGQPKEARCEAAEVPSVRRWRVEGRENVRTCVSGVTSGEQRKNLSVKRTDAKLTKASGGGGARRLGRSFVRACGWRRAGACACVSARVRACDVGRAGSRLSSHERYANAFGLEVSAPTGQRSTTLPLISELSAASTYVPISIALPRPTAPS
eukprot:2797761-Pleurochrysis_carterae.AAC.1